MQERIAKALDTADIKMWELFRVDNTNSSGIEPPLGIPEKDAAANAVAGSLAAI